MELLNLKIYKISVPRETGGGEPKGVVAKCPAGRQGTSDEVANVAELLLGEKGAFIIGSDFLMDGGATASYFYGDLRPE